MTVKKHMVMVLYSDSDSARLDSHMKVLSGRSGRTMLSHLANILEHIYVLVPPHCLSKKIQKFIKKKSKSVHSLPTYKF